MTNESVRVRNVLVAVRDRAVDAYNRPFVAPSRGAAIRSFMDEVNRKAPDNPMCDHPEDFDLYEVGYWDEDKGRVVTSDLHPLMICVGKDVVNIA